MSRVLAGVLRLGSRWGSQSEVPAGLWACRGRTSLLGWVLELGLWSWSLRRECPGLGQRGPWARSTGQRGRPGARVASAWLAGPSRAAPWAGSAGSRPGQLVPRARSSDCRWRLASPASIGGVRGCPSEIRPGRRVLASEFRFQRQRWSWFRVSGTNAGPAPELVTAVRFQASHPFWQRPRPASCGTAPSPAAGPATTLASTGFPTHHRSQQQR